MRERLDGRKNAARDGGRERSERVVDGSVRAHRTGTKEEHYVILLVFYVYILLSSIPLSTNTLFIYPAALRALSVPPPAGSPANNGEGSGLSTLFVRFHIPLPRRISSR